ncbi:serine/threonine protein kinase [Eggerthella sp. YY7918]|nr:serine/threonine protein kinase [Eggerthella sp. YY7918]
MYVGPSKNLQNTISAINMRGVAVGLPYGSVIQNIGSGNYRASYFCKNEEKLDSLLNGVESNGGLAKNLAASYFGSSTEEEKGSIADANWFLSESFEDKDESLKEVFFDEVNRHIKALCTNAQSVLIEYSSDTTIDVSGWPKKPYHVKSTVRRRRVGVGSNVFYDCFHFADRLRAETFKYSSIRIIDEDGNVILDMDRLPSNKEGLSKDDIIESFSVADWDVSCEIRTQEIEKRIGSSIDVLEYALRKKIDDNSFYKVILRCWTCCGAEYKWRNCSDAEQPKKGKKGLYCSTDIRIEAPHDTKTTIELVCEFDTWSVGFSTFFQEYVYEPSIRASIKGRNEEYTFTLRQFSSQSPFWRRKDGKHFVTDLATEMLSDRLIAWKYTEQWLMIGEGYAIVVEAAKR